jgi:hypothetical protein
VLKIYSLIQKVLNLFVKSAFLLIFINGFSPSSFAFSEKTCENLIALLDVCAYNSDYTCLQKTKAIITAAYQVTHNTAFAKEIAKLCLAVCIAPEVYEKEKDKLLLECTDYGN